jgi:DNA-binding transcriptional ArsR family regulator
MDGAGPLELDAAALKALAHPLRIELWELLREHGAATATQLAERTGQNTGVVSYHLRQLAGSGLIEEAEGRSPGRGKGRERWWRAIPGGFSFRPDLVAADAAPAAELLVGEMVRRRTEELIAFQRNAPTLPEEWVAASVNSSYTLRMTAKRLAEFTAEVRAVIERYASDEEVPGTAAVAVQFHAFPVDVDVDDDHATRGTA